MDDLDNAVSACIDAQSAGTEIDDAAARVIGALFQSGNAGSAFATSGAISDPSAVWHDLFESPRGFYASLDDAQRLMADMLGTYLQAAGERGPVTGWNKIWL